MALRSSKPDGTCHPDAESGAGAGRDPSPDLSTWEGLRVTINRLPVRRAAPDEAHHSFIDSRNIRLRSLRPAALGASLVTLC